MATNLAQRGGEKALWRKAVARNKRKAEMADRNKTVGPGEGTSGPPQKASGALLDIAAPLLRDDDCPRIRHKSLIMAMVAWNLSLLPVAERKEKMRGFFDILLGSLAGDDDKFDAAEGFAEFEDMIAPLISRKLTLYPNDHRYLLNLDLQQTDHGYRVDFASALADAA
jgi:hypothetical protein